MSSFSAPCRSLDVLQEWLGLLPETTYKRIEKDPTQEIKQELVQQLKELKDEGIIDEKLHKELSPGACQIPRAYGSPKVHKEGYPLREIVDSTNSVAKNIDKYVSRIIKTYTIDNEHAIKNCKDFVEKIDDQHDHKHCYKPILD